MSCLFLRIVAWMVVGCLVATLAMAQGSGPVLGTVHDSSGGVVTRATVTLLTARQTIVGTVATDAQGRFSFAGVAPGRYLLVVAFPGFSERRVAVTAGGAKMQPVVVVLEPEGVRAEVTVTANPGVVEDVRASSQPVNVIDTRDITERAKAVVAQAIAEEAGVHLLRTAPVMAGIYVRGLTGNKVNVFVDGVRYSTSAARGGVSTFLDLIEPTTLEGIEVLRGPNSAQYGSDAIGGSVQFLSPVPTFASDGHGAFHGLFSLRGNSTDQSGSSNVTTGYAASRLGVLLNLAGRRINDVRTGGDYDTHAAATRFFGIRSDEVMPGRLPDTSFTQYGGMLKLNWAPTANDQVIAYYTRGQQDGAKRYDQLLGGDGNLVADLRNLMLDLFYLKYNRTRVGWFDQMTTVYSVNSQREERVNQGGNGNPRGAITHEYERTTVQGFQAHLGKRVGGRQDLAIGGELYPERIKAPSFSFNPVTQVSTIRRGRVPDKASFWSGGLYAQDVVEVGSRVKLTGNVRFSHASYSSKAADSPVVGGKALWPDDSLSVSSVTFRGGMAASLNDRLSVSANVSRGFRAPHMTDLGTVGLTGSGYQVSASALQGLGAMVGSTAGADAVSTGRPAEQVRPETSLSYEGGVHFRTRRFSTDLSVFVNDVNDNIAYQSLILPSGAVGQLLGDQPITSQGATGVVYVPASSAPVLIRTNFGDARIWGIEHTAELKASSRWTVSTAFTYMRAKDKDTGLPPNIEGGTPAPDGYLKIRYLHPGGRFWLVPYVHAAARQTRLSSLDLSDRRTGATRSRSNIRSFFLNGATVRGWIGAGPDGTLGNADDVLLATGETLAQIQNRVLGSGVDSAPMWTAVPGYVTVSVRGGIRLGAQSEITIDAENLGDRNYRGIAWGVDAPGFGVAVGFQTRF